MPSGKSVSYQQGEYPELSGLENGAPVELRIKGHLETQDGESGNIVFDEVEISTANQADRALMAQATQSYQPSGKSSKGMGDDF